MVDSTNFDLSVNSGSNIGMTDQNSLNSGLSQTASLFTEAIPSVPSRRWLGFSSSPPAPAPAGELETSLVNIVNSLDEIQGTVTLADGVLVSAIDSPFGALTGTANVTDLANNFLDTLSQVNGTLNLANGIASGNLDLGDEDFVGSFNFAQLVSSFVGDWITTLDGTVAFQNGQIAIDLPTSLGNVAGTIDFGSGQLVTDLTTPFGDVDFAINFPQNAQYTFPVSGSETTIDLNTGTVAIDLLAQVPGGEAVVPLTALSGNVTFLDGTAIVALATPLGSFNFNFDAATEVTEGLSEFLTSVSGTLAIANGSLISDLGSSAGAFAGTFNLSQLIADFIPQIPQYSGTVSFTNGIVVAEGTTPYGDFDTTYDYGQYLDEVALFVGDIVV